MRKHIVMWITMATMAMGFTRPVSAALTADEVRGGWISDIDGQRHIYILNVRGTNIRGIYCWDCKNPDNLAFVLDGKLDADHFSFVLLHNGRPGASYSENVSGKVVDGQLILTVQRKGSRARPVEMTMMREPRRPRDGAILPGRIAPLRPGDIAPAAAAAAAPPAGAALDPVAQAAAGRAAAPAVGAAAGGGGAGGGRAGGAGGRGGYVPPGPNEPITVAKITGLWVGFGNGPAKQHFMFRQVGNEIRGMVCGPCDNPFTFGALDNGVIMGDTFKFNIVHEDWGAGSQDGPFNNQATVTIAENEFRLRTQQDNRPIGVGAGDAILTGPIRLDPPAKK